METQALEKIFSYQDAPITFRCDDGTTMVNATQMSKPFGKRPADWLRLPSTKEYSDALKRHFSSVRKSHTCENELVITVNRAPSKGGGTWMHEDVALEFARWLSPEFAIWCNDRIKELLLNGYSALPGTALKGLEMKVDKIAQQVESLLHLPALQRPPKAKGFKALFWQDYRDFPPLSKLPPRRSDYVRMCKVSIVFRDGRECFQLTFPYKWGKINWGIICEFISRFGGRYNRYYKVFEFIEEERAKQAADYLNELYARGIIVIEDADFIPLPDIGKLL